MVEAVLASIRKARVREAARCSGSGSGVEEKTARVGKGGHPPVTLSVRKQVMGLHEAGDGPTAISRRLGLHRSTVSRIIQQESDPNFVAKEPTSLRRDTCKRGHDMAVHARPNPGGRVGRFCSECKRMRERARRAGTKL